MGRNLRVHLSIGCPRYSNFTASASFRIRKGIGLSHSSRSSHVFGLVLPTSPSLVLVPLLGYSYTVRRELISNSCKITQAANLNRRRRLSRKAQCLK